MSGKQSRVNFHLDSKGLEPLSPLDIRAILRGADPLIEQGGRTLLVKILKGSRDRDVLSRGLDSNPAYGFYRSLTADQVLARIDWTILHGYLRVVYAGRLPVLIYTALGWSIESDAYADELVRSFDQLLQSSPPPYDMGHLVDRNRELIWLTLDKVQGSGDPKYVPLLEDWARIDHKKVRQRIRQVIAHLKVLP